MVQQTLGRGADPQVAQAVARGMVRHAVGEACADVVLALLVQEGGQLVDPRRQRVDRIHQPCVSGPPGQVGVGVPDGGDARRRRRHHGLGLTEDAHEATQERQRGVVPAGVVVDLAAAGRLVCREVDAVAEAFQHAHGGDARRREERVVEARHEQRDAHRPASLVCVPGSMRHRGPPRQGAPG